MSELRAPADLIVNPRFWGMPTVPLAGTVEMPGKWCSFIRGINRSLGDWWTVRYGRSKIKEAISEGIPADRIVVNFLGFDTEDVDPLWSTDGMHRRIDTMKEFGIRHVVAPDFSLWSDMPRIVRLHNTYKSAVCTHDLLSAGFNLIPNVRVDPVDPLMNALILMPWSKDSKVVLVDVCHDLSAVGGHVAYLKKVEAEFPRSQMIVYYSAKGAAREYWAAARTKPTLCPSYNIVRGAYITHKSKAARKTKAGLNNG